MSVQSLRIGVSGLNASQTRLDVISNNISNSSTVAFKEGRASFSETLGEEVVGKDRSSGGGGVNSSKVGRGVSVASVDRNFSQGSLDKTGVKTDLALNGDGFFIASPKEGVGSQQRRLTRAGDFTFNQNGKLVTNGGLNVKGWEVNEQGEAQTGELKDIKLDPNAQSSPKFTSEAKLAGNLPANAKVGDTTSISSVVYDEQGTAHNVVVEFEKTADNQWDYTIKASNNASKSPFQAEEEAYVLQRNGKFFSYITEDDISGNGKENILTTDSESKAPKKSNVELPNGNKADDPKFQIKIKEVSKGFISKSEKVIAKDTVDKEDIIQERSKIVDAIEPEGYKNGDEKEITSGKKAWYYEKNGNFVSYVTDADLKSGSGPGKEDNLIITEGSNSSLTKSEVNIPSEFGSKSEITLKKAGPSDPKHIDSGYAYDDDGDGSSDKVIVNGTTNKGDIVEKANNLENNTSTSETTTEIGPFETGTVEFNTDGSVVSTDDTRGDPSIDWKSQFVEGGKSLELDFSGLTQYSGSNTSKFQSQNGHTSGELAGFSFTKEGKLQLNYTNGEQEQTYQLAIGNVNNPNGLEQQGENFYTTTSASGDLQLGRAGRDLQTSVVSGSLESSNVDLAQEFADLIEAQRSYQASARVVTTADQVLQETVQLKR